MPGRYRNSQNKNRSRFYILLSIVFVFVMFKWGLPLFMDLLAGSGAKRVTTGEDIIPPQSPVISALPEATNSSRILVEGYSESGASIELLLNDEVNKITKTDVNGYFVFDAPLLSGQNRVQLRAKDEDGNESMSEVSLVTFDSKPVDLVVISPRDGSEFFGKINQVVDIKGEVDKEDSQVTINSSFVMVNRDGTFVHRFMMNSGENEVKVNAVDPAGNMAEKTIRLYFTP